MGERLLTGIIELEKSLREELRQEEVRVAAWQERELAGLAAGLADARRELVRRHEEAATTARRAAQAEGSARLAAAAARCARLAALPDAFLEELLHRQLGMLLPEDGDDHPDDQS